MKTYIKLWLSIIFIYALDCIIITPYILYRHLGEEVGLIMSWGFSGIGLIWFPIWFIIFSALTFFVIKWFDKSVDKHCGEYSAIPKVILIITFWAMMIITMLNNLRFII